MNELNIIYEDNDLILCHKPAGVATQTRRFGQQDMESLLKNYRAKKGEPPYIGIIHRLDQPVEGLMVFAKNQKAAASLSKQVQQHMIGKHYYAVSTNAPAEKEGVLEDYLLTDKKTNFTQVIDVKGTNGSAADIPKDAKKAKLEYKVIGEQENRTLFDIKLHTGRQHQIRVQLANIGCPLIGDSKYGVSQIADNKQVSARDSLALCSYRLNFTHPTTGEKMDYRIKPQGRVFQEKRYS